MGAMAEEGKSGPSFPALNLCYCFRGNETMSIFKKGGMKVMFRDRREAGELLAEKMSAYEGRRDAVVLGLPRGGVPVAYEVALRLRLPLDVFVVRKLGVPGHEELAMGAIATGGVRVMNDDVVAHLRLTEEDIQAVAEQELKELNRREKLYRNGREPIPLQGKTIFLVDDGVATGSTILAGVTALRKRGAAKIVVSVPTVAAATLPDLEENADEVVAVMAPESFMAVGQWYEDFSQTTDQEVQEFLERARQIRAA